jgi:hypothetical protein
MIPRDPTVRELSLFQTGAPELVLHCGPLKELDGRYCRAQQRSTRLSEPKQKPRTSSTSREVPEPSGGGALLETVGVPCMGPWRLTIDDGRRWRCARGSRVTTTRGSPRGAGTCSGNERAGAVCRVPGGTLLGPPFRWASLLRVRAPAPCSAPPTGYEPRAPPPHAAPGDRRPEKIGDYQTRFPPWFTR